jgi:hypothetical protein
MRIVMALAETRCIASSRIFETGISIWLSASLIIACIGKLCPSWSPPPVSSSALKWQVIPFYHSVDSRPVHGPGTGSLRSYSALGVVTLMMPWRQHSVDPKS